MGYHKSNSSTGVGSLFMGRHDKEYHGRYGVGYGSTQAQAKRDYYDKYGHLHR